MNKNTTTDERPWDLLREGDQLHMGDEVRRDHKGLTVTAVVSHVDEDGDLWTAEGGFLVRRKWGTWYVRRAALNGETA